MVLWNTRRVAEAGVVPVLAKAHTDVDIQTMKIAFFDETRCAYIIILLCVLQNHSHSEHILRFNVEWDFVLV